MARSFHDQIKNCRSVISRMQGPRGMAGERGRPGPSGTPVSITTKKKKQ